MTPLKVLITALVAVLFSCKSQDVPMDEPFDSLFASSLTASGDRYRQLRAQVLELDARQVAALEQLRSNPDWRVRLQAEIYAGWRSQPDAFARVQRLAFGTDPSQGQEQYLAGKPPLENAVRDILREGPAYAPALLEILHKEWDGLSEYAFLASSGPLVRWQEPLATPVFQELLRHPERPLALRHLALRPLADLMRRAAYADLVAVYQDEDADLELRAAALSTLGTLDDVRANEMLEKTLRDPKALPLHRAAAATGLGETRHPRFVPVLVQQYRASNDEDVKKAIIRALGALNHKDALEPLRQLQEEEENPALRDLIRYALLDLEYLDR